MFYTYQCQCCQQHIFPKRAICPFCYNRHFLKKEDANGIIQNYTIDQRSQAVISVVQTTHNVLVVTQSPHVIAIGQPVYIQQNKNKILSFSDQETTS